MRNKEIIVNINVNTKKEGWEKDIIQDTLETQRIYAEDLDAMFVIKRINRDVNGNPRAEIKIYKDYYYGNSIYSSTEDFRGVVGRYYKKSDKIITQCFDAREIVTKLVENF